MPDINNGTPIVPHSKLKHTLKTAGLFVFEFLKVVIIAGAIILAVRYFIFKPFYVKGASMEPNFYDREYLIIDEITYRYHEPARGEVIVFHYPANPKEYFLKRIIGLPGERVKISGGKVTIYNTVHPEGVILDESYLPADLATLGEKTFPLDNKQYFVLGDNRMNSFDSRSFGPIDKGEIVGRAWLRGWPVTRVQIFHAPAYGS